MANDQKNRNSSGVSSGSNLSNDRKQDSSSLDREESRHSNPGDFSTGSGRSSQNRDSDVERSSRSSGSMESPSSSRGDEDSGGMRGNLDEH